MNPVEIIHPDNLPDARQEHLEAGLKAIVAHSAHTHNVGKDIHAPMHSISNHVSWIHSLIPGIEKLAATHHVGNFVLVRETGETIFEIGMHLLFYGKEQVKALGTQTVSHLLEEQSIKQGKVYDSIESAKSIASFVQVYALDLEELLEPDLMKYNCFNDFFSRKLRPDARPVQHLNDPSSICSAADSRLTVYQSVDLAKEFWIKGRNFNIPNLLQVPSSSDIAQAFDDASLAIFRLAPADYHRFHSPIDCVVGDVEHVPGYYYTVNPQAVNEKGFDIFTANTRSVLYLTHQGTGLPVAFVAIGALLVGSIRWTNGSEKGRIIQRGEELGHFAYGGSTIVVVFPKGIVEFDADLIANSKKPIETLVKVGHSIGKTPMKEAI